MSQGLHESAMRQATRRTVWNGQASLSSTRMSFCSSRSVKWE